MDAMKQFSEKLKMLREELELNQSQMADRLGVSRGSISFYENGDRIPDIEFLSRVSEAFHVSSDWLLGFNDVRSSDPEVQQICKYTGLSEYAVETLRFFNFWFEGTYLIPTINLLIEQEELPPDHDVDFCYDTDNPTEQEEDDYRQAWENWEKRGLIPILSIIDNFFSIDRNPESIYDLCVTGELLKAQQRNGIKGLRLESIRKIPASDVIERVLLSDIEDSLKKLKEKESHNNRPL